ncbi:mitochondrial-processing peptidase subunit alpha-like isoform X2 [Rhododendron vialii]|uniref:mitochondrial-processing peptidase subunit alpha-like isoform X2 n=1 Tax=Rhododendron vialii TaxID=182163 RepID=UPI002660094F|nr:mitochondrial-processing peptidase subunit alpha-like isoform X2 [Rhododendron vialii]
MVHSASGVEHEELLKIHFFRTWPAYLVLRSQSLSMLEVIIIVRGICKFVLKTQFALAFEAPGGCLKEKEAANQAIVLTVLQILMGGGGSFSAADPGKGMYSWLCCLWIVD